MGNINGLSNNGFTNIPLVKYRITIIKDSANTAKFFAEQIVSSDPNALSSSPSSNFIQQTISYNQRAFVAPYVIEAGVPDVYTTTVDQLTVELFKQ